MTDARGRNLEREAVPDGWRALGARLVAPLRGLACGLLDAAMPQTCIGCGAWVAAGGRLTCDDCQREIDVALARDYCPRCGRTLPRAAIHEEFCARCRTERFWNVAGVARIGTYVPAIRLATLDLKYHGRERNADYFADLLAHVLRERGWATELDALVPVPMHWLRRLQRPCDHAHVLADALGRRVKIPVVRLVRRAKHSPSQTGIESKQARFDNVKECFAPARRWRHVPRWWGEPDVAGKTVCIVDNLISAGATMHEVSKALRKAGARRIYAAVIVRTAAPGDPAAGLPEVPTDSA